MGIRVVECLRHKLTLLPVISGDCYEAIGLWLVFFILLALYRVLITHGSALFLLFLQYASPGGTFDEATFDAVRAAEEGNTAFNWPKISWIFVFQYPIVEVLCTALQDGTEAAGRYCLNSLSPKYAHLWVQIISSFSEYSLRQIWYSCKIAD
jgi:hypothetical protein